MNKQVIFRSNLIKFQISFSGMANKSMKQTFFLRIPVIIAVLHIESKYRYRKPSKSVQKSQGL